MALRTYRTLLAVILALSLNACGAVSDAESGATSIPERANQSPSASALAQPVSEEGRPLLEDSDRIPGDPNAASCNGECCRFRCTNGSRWINRATRCGECNDEGRAWCRRIGSGFGGAWWGDC